MAVLFDLLSSAEEPVTTGHADGVVTIDLAEGDDPHREALRVQLAEPYRTLLGHLRHETGHWYWTVLVQPDPEPFRALFGDERADYAAALERHYGASPPAGWPETAVSTYATAHPWEDWAETFAHYLHIQDTLQTAGAFGLAVDGPAAVTESPLAATPRELDPTSFAQVIDTWLPLTYALNAVSRSMGKEDLYPSYLSAPGAGEAPLRARRGAQPTQPRPGPRVSQGVARALGSGPSRRESAPAGVANGAPPAGADLCPIRPLRERRARRLGDRTGQPLRRRSRNRQPAARASDNFPEIDSREAQPLRIPGVSSSTAWELGSGPSRRDRPRRVEIVHHLPGPIHVPAQPRTVSPTRWNSLRSQ